MEKLFVSIVSTLQYCIIILPPIEGFLRLFLLFNAKENESENVYLYGKHYYIIY
jgi:hypothetical protein